MKLYQLIIIYFCLGFFLLFNSLYGAESVRGFKETLVLANSGNAEAQLSLGMMYEKGTGTPVNYFEAMKWFKKSAEQGLADAQYWVGMMHSSGPITQTDIPESIKWFKKAAEQGHTSAQNSLGYLYKGYETPQFFSNDIVSVLDYVQAYAYFNCAKAAGNDEAADNIDFLTSKMTPQQIAKGQKLSKVILERINKKK